MIASAQPPRNTSRIDSRTIAERFTAAPSVPSCRIIGPGSYTRRLFAAERLLLRRDWLKKGTGLDRFAPLATRPDSGQLPWYHREQPGTGVIRLVKADLDVRAFLQVYGIDKSHLALVQRQNHGRGTHAFPKKAHALQQIAVCDSRAGKNDLFARCQIFRGVNSLGIFDSHFF